MDRDRAFELLAGARAPAAPSREDKVRWIAEVGDELLAAHPPSPAKLFVGGALRAWLERGGDLEDYLRVRRRGSHLTPQRLLARLIADEDERADGAVGSASSSTAKDSTE